MYTNGAPSGKLTNEQLVDSLEKMIREKVAEKISADAANPELIAVGH